MKLLLDTRSLQVSLHLGDNNRLREFLSIAEDVGYDEIENSSGDDSQFSAESLDDVTVVAILTRLRGNPFSCSELEDLQRYLESGGSVLLASNHPRSNENDSVLSERYDISLAEFVEDPIDDDDLIRTTTEEWFSQIAGVDLLDIAFNNGCAVFSNKPETQIIATLPVREDDGVFSVMLDPIGKCGGKLIVIVETGLLRN
jgi:hypothetical protein